MKNVLILGASGTIARHVIDILVKKDDVNLTLFLRNSRRLRNTDVSKCRIIEDDVLNSKQLSEAVAGQDIVYANLAGDLEAMAKNIVQAMNEKGPGRPLGLCTGNIPRFGSLPAINQSREPNGPPRKKT